MTIRPFERQCGLLTGAVVIALLSACAPGSARVAAAPTSPRTLVAVFAHPDDETLVAPALVRYAREGVRVFLVIATDGRRGANAHARIPAGDSLAKVRAAEARCSARALGLEPPILLGFPDAGLADFAPTATVTFNADDRQAAVSSVACHWSQATLEQQAENLRALDHLWQGAVTFQQWGGGRQASLY